MNRYFSTVVSMPVVLAAALVALPVNADDGDGGHRHSHATASFGRGLNTAQPGNPVNHAVLPKVIRIKAGGVVDISVAGFHDVVILKPGFTLADLRQAGDSTR